MSWKIGYAVGLLILAGPLLLPLIALVLIGGAWTIPIGLVLLTVGFVHGLSAGRAAANRQMKSMSQKLEAAASLARETARHAEAHRDAQDELNQRFPKGIIFVDPGLHGPN